MRKIIIALGFSITCCVWFNYAHAGFELKKHRHSLAAIQQRYRHYVRRQLQFLNNLRSCRPSTIRMRNPEHPNILLVKQILGRHHNFCRVQKIIINTSRANPSRHSMICHFRGGQLRELTSSESYRYIRSLAKKYHHTHDLALEAPSMLKLERSGACRQHRDITASAVGGHLFRK